MLQGRKDGGRPEAILTKELLLLMHLKSDIRTQLQNPTNCSRHLASMQACGVGILQAPLPPLRLAGSAVRLELDYMIRVGILKSARGVRSGGSSLPQDTARKQEVYCVSLRRSQGLGRLTRSRLYMSSVISSGIKPISSENS